MTARNNGILWTSGEAKAATGGTSEGLWEATGVAIDSRKVQPGDLFVALAGPSFDGHDFVADALARGAAAAVVSRVPEKLTPGAPLLVVTDTLRALHDLATAARVRSRARIVAITGSVGKTGTKEALRRVLGLQGRTAATEGNLNNHIGVPLSLARLPRDAAFAVFELGMNHAGELTPLARMVRPHVALITTVERAHSAHFVSVEEIADAKAEILAGLEAGGTAVLNRDNPHFERLAGVARRHGARVVSFGQSELAEARVLDVFLEPARSLVVAEVAGQALSFRIGTPGRHWVANCMAVLAVAGALGADLAAAAAALEGLRAPDGRGRSCRVCIDGGDFQLIDDSYNANPASMAAALAVLGQSRPGPGGRRIAILGDMLELGPDSAEHHARLVLPLESARVDLVFTAGREMVHLWDALPRPMRGGHAASSDRLAPLVRSAIEPGDVVVVKGSAGSRMGRVVAALKAMDAGAERKFGAMVVNGE